MYFTLVYNFAIIIVLAVTIYMLARPIVRGAMYFPTTSKNVEVAMRLTGVGTGVRVVDLGSGDGRLLVACAERGACVEGYEINPTLVWRSRRMIREKNLRGQASVHWKSFWRVDLSKFDVVFVYGIPYIMKGLEKKFIRELKPGTKIVSNVFQFPGWTPVAQEGNVFLYQISVPILPLF
jgi:SAM-dependent methyltransferase